MSLPPAVSHRVLGCEGSWFQREIEQFFYKATGTTVEMLMAKG